MHDPAAISVYHIVHLDRLSLIINDGWLFSDSEMSDRPDTGTMIGINEVKTRRRHKPLNSYPDLMVGDCVPFNFCPRSVMLYLIHRGNHLNLPYRNGQQEIVHLRLNMQSCIRSAEQEGRRWAFTRMNAAAALSEDFTSTDRLNTIDWTVIESHRWSGDRDEKQAEFLVEQKVPFTDVNEIGVFDQERQDKVTAILSGARHNPPVNVRRQWYY